MIFYFRLTKSEILNQMDNLFVFNAFAPLRLCETFSHKDVKTQSFFIWILNFRTHEIRNL